MADFELTAAVKLAMDKAVTEVKKLQGRLKGVADSLGLLSKKGTLDTKKLTSSLAFLGATAGAAFAAIVSASPSMRMAFFEMKVAVNQLWMSIGEELAPIIQDILIPAIKAISEWVQNLSPEMKQWIGLTIGITVAITGVVAIIMVLNAVSLPLIAVIVGIAAAIAFIILLWRNWNDIIAGAIDWWKEASSWLKGLAVVIAIVAMPITVMIGLIVGVIAVFKNWGNILEWIGGIAETVGSFFTNMFSGIGKAIVGVASIFWNVLVSIFEIFLNPWNKLIDKMIDWKITGPKMDTFLGRLKITLPRAHGGTTVTGTQDQLFRLKPRERVRTEVQEQGLQQRLRGGNGGFGGNITINVASVDSRERVNELVRLVKNELAKDYRKRGI